MSRELNQAAVFIGVHLRTDGVHVVAATDQGDVVAEVSNPFIHKETQPAANKNAYEESPDTWWDATYMAIGRLVQNLKPQLASASQLKAISVCCRAGDIIALDRRGKPVMPAILLEDERGAEYVRNLNFHGREHCQRLGINFHATDPLAKIAWAKDNFPDQYENMLFAHKADYILGQLKGMPDVTEFSFAVRTGCDLVEECWPDWIDYDMYLGVRDRLPALKHFGQKVGVVSAKAAAATGLPAGIDVVLGTVSHVATFLASGARKVGDFHTMLDDHLSISGISKKLILAAQEQVKCHKLPDRTWTFTIESQTGAAWIKNWFGAGAFDELEPQAEKLLPCTYLAYPNVTKGETFPFISNGAEGFISPATDDRVVQFASCLQGTAMFERYCYQKLSTLAALAGVSGDIYSGGEWSKSNFWMQCRADVMGKVNCRMKGRATAAFGAAMIAALGSTFNNNIEEVASAMVAVEGTFFPDLEKHVRYSELYQNFCALMEDQGYSVTSKQA